ncbi:DMT family transporter [Aureimonas leprariae]|uniref:DMT family transporter n=1 Tax=Plantimonas leprariae TaxID=2615207 RepID=A0A7V7PM06_9HYPH|nr:DMT family transporter [Aureimonas leprariae]KAB0677526.1 DMT family transporter [Aureimonas leprariae]
MSTAYGSNLLNSFSQCQRPGLSECQTRRSAIRNVHFSLVQTRAEDPPTAARMAPSGKGCGTRGTHPAEGRPHARRCRLIKVPSDGRQPLHVVGTQARSAVTKRSSAITGSTAARGATMVLIATVAWSFAGVFTRSLTLDVMTTVALRALAGGTMLFLAMLLRRGPGAFGDLIAIGRVGWFAVVLSAVAQAATTAGLFMTSVAHVTVIYATCPFLAAIIARLWLGEVIPRATLLAIVASISGVLVVMSASTASGTLVGDAVALVMTLSFATIIVLSKAHPDLRLFEVTIVSAFLTFGLFIPFASDVNLDAANVAIVSAYGLTNMVVAFFLFIKGARHIPAATSGLIVTLEIVLSPLWVWLFFDETVDAATFLGGAIVLAAVIGHLVHSLSRGARIPVPALIEQGHG